MYSVSHSQADLAAKSEAQIAVGEAANDRVDGGAVTDYPKGFRFWMIFVAICVSMFLSALEFVSAGTLPRFTAYHLLLVLNFYVSPHDCARSSG